MSDYSTRRPGPGQNGCSYLPSCCAFHNCSKTWCQMWMRSVIRWAAIGLAIFLVIPSHSVAQSRYFTFEQNTDRPGSDYTDVPSAGASDCSFACQIESQCRAWTYVRPGIQYRSGRCWLKKAVPEPVATNCCTSGMRMGRPGRF